MVRSNPCVIGNKYISQPNENKDQSRRRIQSTKESADEQVEVMKQLSGFVRGMPARGLRGLR